MASTQGKGVIYGAVKERRRVQSEKEASARTELVGPLALTPTLSGVDADEALAREQDSNVVDIHHGCFIVDMKRAALTSCQDCLSDSSRHLTHVMISSKHLLLR